MARKTTPAARPAASKTADDASSPVTMSEAPEVNTITMSDPEVPNDPPPAVIDGNTGEPFIDGSPERGIAMEFQQLQPEPPQVANDPVAETPCGIDAQAIVAKPDTRANDGVGGSFGGRTTGAAQAAANAAPGEDPAPEPGRSPEEDPQPAGAPGAAKVGETVLYRLGSHSHWNGAKVAPAIVTRVFDEDADGRLVVGLTVLPPGAPPFALHHVRSVGEDDDEAGWFFP